MVLHGHRLDVGGDVCLTRCAGDAIEIDRRVEERDVVGPRRGLGLVGLAGHRRKQRLVALDQRRELRDERGARAATSRGMMQLARFSALADVVVFLLGVVALGCGSSSDESGASSSGAAFPLARSA